MVNAVRHAVRWNRFSGGVGMIEEVGEIDVSVGEQLVGDVVPGVHAPRRHRSVVVGARSIRQ